MKIDGANYYRRVTVEILVMVTIGLVGGTVFHHFTQDHETILLPDTRQTSNQPTFNPTNNIETRFNPQPHDASGARGAQHASDSPL